MSVKCLCRVAKGTRIRNYCKLRKSDLIEALIKFDEGKVPRKERDESLCEHGDKYSCRKCVGGGICVHNRRRCFCKECGGSQICIHNRQRCFCKECGGSQICIHNKQKSSCKKCRTASSITEEGTNPNEILNLKS